MHKAKLTRLKLAALYFTLFSLGVILLLFFFHDNIVYFLTPKEIQNYERAKLTKGFKLGGYVKDNSIKKINEETIEFILTDFEQDITTRYTGIVPNLFREGQGTIATGKINDNNIFIASEILAKHDENYIPKEVVDSIKKIGQWRENS